MLGRSLSILAAAAAILLAVAWKLHGDGNPMAEGLLWGLGGGLVAALSALAGALYAVSRNLPMNKALAIVVVGMLFRMLFLAVLTVVAVKLAEVDPIGFVAGFGGVFLVGQLLEVLTLARSRTARAQDGQAHEKEPARE